MRSAAWLCALAVVAGCKKEEGKPKVGPSPTPKAPPAPVADPSDFEVHEWGLVRFGAGAPRVATSGSAPGGFGLGMSGTGPGGGKPVLYFHPGPHFDAKAALSVTVSFPGGALREIWPTLELGGQPTLGESYTWKGVKILVGKPTGPDAAPKPDGSPCAGLTDGPCEAAELPGYMPAVPDGLDVDGVGAPVPVLLYNGHLAPQAPPLALGADGTLTSTAAYGFGATWVRLPSGKIQVVDAIGAKGTRPTADASAAALPIGDLRAQVHAALVARGLTADEATAFVEAWSPDVLAEGATWKVLSLYPAEAIDALAPLAIAPAPKKVVRVMAIVVE